MLVIRNLTKNYGNFVAVNHINMHVGKGEIFGFVGPNGAGKTTTMRICCGLLKATAGQVFIGGTDAFRARQSVKRKIGYVPDFFGVYDNLKVMEYMQFFGSMYGMRPDQVTEISRGLLKLVNLAEWEETLVDKLSRGMKQRLCVARALIHNPELLILDEPNSGLDPRARFEMKEVIKNLSSMGKTIIISSHILPELSEMCTSIGVMDRGRMILSGKVEDIMSQSQFTQPIRVKLEAGVSEAKERAVRMIRENPLVERVTFTEEEIFVYFRGGDKEAGALLKHLIESDIPIVGYYREKGDLESLFLKITGLKR